MTLGYDKRLYLLAFDHRGSFEHDLFGASEPVSATVRDGIIKVKEIIFDAHAYALAAGAPAGLCGVLVDGEFGAGVARRAKDAGVVAQARSEGRDGVKCVVLGRGADEPQVIEWVRIGAAADGIDGFAVGRTLWEEALTDFVADKASRMETVERIAARYQDVIEAYVSAAGQVAGSAQ